MPAAHPRLYRNGWQADAVAHYQDFHRRLVDELGADPGPEPRELHRRLLSADEQAGLYRSIVADRRMLILLDPATTAQVSPLPECCRGHSAHSTATRPPHSAISPITHPTRSPQRARPT